MHQGKYYQIPSREVVPKPLQKPHPPLWGACNQEDTAYMTGKMGFGCLVITHRGAERAHKLISLYKQAIEPGRAPGQVRPQPCGGEYAGLLWGRS